MGLMAHFSSPPEPSNCFWFEIMRFEINRGTLRYFCVLWCTSGYFEVFLGTFRFFEEQILSILPILAVLAFLSVLSVFAVLACNPSSPRSLAVLLISHSIASTELCEPVLQIREGFKKRRKKCVETYVKKRYWRRVRKVSGNRKTTKSLTLKNITDLGHWSTYKINL